LGLEANKCIFTIAERKKRESRLSDEVAIKQKKKNEIFFGV
jgi:hypothetical protein